jgi:hypothetical protein
VTPCSHHFTITKLAKQSFQVVRMTVYVSDNVVIYSISSEVWKELFPVRPIP